METKRFLKKFDSQSDYESQKDSVMDNPHVVLLEDTKKVVFAPLKNNGNESDRFNGYEYVDLGLPSGTLWATKPIMNVNDEVLYFQWGDRVGWTVGQINNGEKEFADDGSDYKWSEGEWSCDGSSITKYNATDGKRVLDLEDDAAHVHMGGDWHIPTKEQLEELTANTTSTWTTQNGVSGRLFISNTNNKSVFVPAFGKVYNGGLYEFSCCCVWISAVNEENLSIAYNLESYYYSMTISACNRTLGQVVFGVIG